MQSSSTQPRPATAMHQRASTLAKREVRESSNAAPRGLAGLLLTCAAMAAVLAAPIAAWAIPADPLPFEAQQPDGTTIKLQARGDEYFHWIEDLDGHTVVLNNAGTYVYAVLDATGELAPTSLVVGQADPVAAGLAKRLLPSKEVRARRPIKPLQMPKESLLRGSGPRGVPPSGTVQNLVVLCKFSDHTYGVDTRQQSDYSVLWNAVGGNPVLAPTGSVKDVYSENSYGTMTLNSTVVAWVTLPQTESYYANGTSGLTPAYPNDAQGMVKDALDLVDSMVNFANFDADTDGYIDCISIIHSGYGAEVGANPNRIWSHKWSLWELPGGQWTSADMNGAGSYVKVYDYHTEPALWSNSGNAISRIGVAAHETGHFFGLPDLYDTDGSSQGAGSWAMMANSWGFNYDQLTPPHFCAWSKVFLGWVTPTVITAPGTFPAAQVETNAVVYQLTNGYPVGEYLLIENRQPVGFDSAMPQGGLCIWHIDDAKGSIYANNVNDDEGHPWQGGWPGNGKHYRVALLQADANYDLERNLTSGDSGDPYRLGGTNSIGAGPSHPNTDAYQNGTVIVTNNSIYNVTSSAATMYFDYNGPAQEACCFGNGSCMDTPPTSCTAFGGTPQGPGSTCAGTQCQVTEACCLPGAVGACADMTVANCQAAGGFPQGPGTSCATTQCRPCVGQVQPAADPGPRQHRLEHRPGHRNAQRRDRRRLPVRRQAGHRGPLVGFLHRLALPARRLWRPAGAVRDRRLADQLPRAADLRPERNSSAAAGALLRRGGGRRHDPHVDRLL